MNNIWSRTNYNAVESKIRSWGMGGFNVQQHILRLEKTLDPNKRFYTFKSNTVDGNISDTEIRLDRNDRFFVCAMALGIQKVDSSNVSRYPVFYNPSPALFSGNPASGLDEHECLEAVYNGKLNVSISSFKTMEDFDTSYFRTVEDRAATETADLITVHEKFTSQYKELNPFPVLDGGLDNDFELVLGGGDIAVINGSVDDSGNADTRRNKLVLQLAGWLVKGASKGTGLSNRLV